MSVIISCHGYITTQYVKDVKHISKHVEQWHRWLLVQRCFRGWHSYIRQQEVKMWEKERQAKVHYHWSVFHHSIL